MGKPVAIAAELDAELFIVDAEVSVAAARHGVRHHRLHFLRDHADIGLRASEIAEAIVAETVVEMPEQHDVVLQREVRAPATAATTESTAAASAAEATAAATLEAAASAATADTTTASHTGVA